MFLNAWKAIYNLYMMNHRSGDMENDTLSRWVKGEVKDCAGARRVAMATPADLLESILKDKRTLLWNAEDGKWRDAHDLVQSWVAAQKKGGLLSPEKSVTYLFLIGRDLRNALSHPKLNPNARNTKQALTLASDHFLSLAVECIQVTIEHPVEGTTGKTTAYRSFLWPFLNNSDSFFSDYYLERLFPDEELEAFPKDAATTALKEIAKQYKSLRHR